MSEDPSSIWEKKIVENAEFILYHEDDIRSLFQSSFQQEEEIEYSTFRARLEKIFTTSGAIGPEDVEDLRSRVNDEREIDYSEAKRHLAEPVASAIINPIIREDVPSVQINQESETAHEATKLVRELGINYGKDLRQSRIREVQGSDYWREINSDFVLRGSNNYPGIDYRLQKAEETVEISTDAAGGIALSKFILQDIIEISESFGVDAITGVSKEEVGDIIEEAEEIKEKLEEYSKEHDLSDFSEYQSEEEDGSNVDESGEEE